MAITCILAEDPERFPPGKIPDKIQELIKISFEEHQKAYKCYWQYLCFDKRFLNN